jgi:hypothetical protein
MTPDLQKQYEHIDAYIQELHRMFVNQASAERYNISKILFVCKSRWWDFGQTWLWTQGWLDYWRDSPVAPNELWSVHYKLYGMEKTVAELHGMLKTGEDSIKKNPNHT